MSVTEYEAANIIPPLENSAAMKSQANIVVSNAGVIQGLSGLFGGTLGDGHFVTIQADGAKIYCKLAPNSAASAGGDAFATGSGTGIVYPIPDGVQLSFRPVMGREVATGVATHCRYDFLHLRVASGGVATAYARVYRSSLAPTQDAGVLKAP